MKTVLCYGDSNTYGYVPETGLRYPRNVRWTGVLQELLGEEYSVIEEGCNGRTTIFDDPLEGWKNGRDYLKPCLNSHKPVDIVIMMLGSNDLKRCFHASAEDIAAGAEILVKDIIEFTGNKQGFVPRIILVSPPEIGEGIRSSAFYGSFDEDAILRSRAFPKSLNVSSSLGTTSTIALTADSKISGVYNGTFNLKAGEKITINGIPVGMEYSVVETSDPAGKYTVEYTNNEGQITSAGAAVVVTNTGVEAAKEEAAAKEATVTEAPNKENKTSAAKTGDNFGLQMMIICMLLSLAVILTLVGVKKKRENY